MINKVLYTIDQRTAVSTSQQKCARDNIGAMPAASASAFEPKITYAYDSASAISSINGSAIGGQGGLTEIYTDNNLTGSGTSGDKLGVANPVLLTSNVHSAWYGSDGLDMSGTGAVNPYMTICASAISASATAATTIMRYSGITMSSGNVEGVLAPSAFTMKNTASDCKTYMQDGRMGININTNGGNDQWSYYSDVEKTVHGLYEQAENVSHTTTHDWVGYSALRYDGGGEDDKFQSSELTYGMLHMNSGFYTGGASSVNKLKINPTSISAGYDIPGSGKTNFLLCTTALNLPDCTNFEIMPGVITWGGSPAPGSLHFQNANGMFFADMAYTAGGTNRISPAGMTVTTTSATASYGTALYKMLSSLSAWATAQGWTP